MNTDPDVLLQPGRNGNGHAVLRPASILAAITPREARDFLPGTLHAELVALAPSFRHLDTTGLSAAQFSRELAETNPEVLVTGWRTPILPPDLPPALRYVCHLAGSVRELVRSEHLEAGLLVTNWGDSISRTIAEWAVALSIMCLRRASFWTLAMHCSGGWKDDSTETASLFGRRVGVHGFGRIARELVQLLRPFHVTLSVFAPDVTPRVETEFGVSRAQSLEELFGANDVIVELAPLNARTVGIITEDLLRRIRPGGVFINLGRGALVDEAALLRVAREGRIQIGLDVFNIEPLPADSGLRGLHNVTMLPHLAGPPNDRRCDAGAFALRNLRAYAAREPLNALITPAIYEMAS